MVSLWMSVVILSICPPILIVTRVAVAVAVVAAVAMFTMQTWILVIIAQVIAVAVA